MAAVHEEVHDHAGADQEPRQNGNRVRPMLGPEEVPADRQEAEQHQAGS